MNDLPAVAGKLQETSKALKTGLTTKAPTGRTPRAPEELQHVIAVAAYYRAESRYFEPGHEIEDWLSAEAEVLAEVESMKGLPA